MVELGEGVFRDDLMSGVNHNVSGADDDEDDDEEMPRSIRGWACIQMTAVTASPYGPVTTSSV